jgi:hypothetical protein
MELFFNFRHMSFIHHQHQNFKIYFRENIFYFREDVLVQTWQTFFKRSAFRR